MRDKEKKGEKAQCTRQYMSILSRFLTQYRVAWAFFNKLLEDGSD